MGRHRRSAPQAPGSRGAAPADVAPPTAPASPLSSVSSGARPPARHGAHRAARGRRTAPLRTGLLGASAAVAMGAVAVASGLIPGHGRFEAGGNGEGGDRVRADALPDATGQGSESATPVDRGTEAASRGSARPKAPETDRPSSAAAPSTSPSPHRPSQSPSRESGSPAPAKSPGRTASATPEPSATPSKTPDAGTSAEAQVLSLVNQERAQAGCSPVTADKELAGLAQQFSDDMAARDFFGHTDPDGDTPWDRARDLGITDLGGENIARGQANAQSVMDTWMNSPGHRANILNCDYKTMGVGVHFGSGGPWWTQDFGF
ncbi:CAP domain-containing protein [Streptomyces halobius]|uniref:CAP domain-containing protein n=1 Tax=Streptomyces halobius TaxID=2879846 RepID=A0ABY4M558_9ACTN|nr:CAP domain-containing protein [Streptomyces halobius]UQA92899.1 CAP domain-containing protein [Streptomyces halobius]